MEYGNEDDVNRAIPILETIVDLQDQDPSHATYGIWAYFYEESIEEMAMPDWNMADFNGKQLVLTLKKHMKRLPHQTVDRIKHAIHCACEAIIKRNVGPGYTNICVMGALITLAGGELLDNRTFVEYGVKRLEALLELTTRMNAYVEYNSSHYAMITADELDTIRTIVDNADALRIADALYHFTWNSIGKHYHARTGQWSGPHSRSYVTLLHPDCQEYHFIERGTKEAYKDAGFTRCPEDLLSLFVTEEQRYFKSESLDEAYSGYQNIATTYVTEEFALGSFSNDFMWNQRRNLIAYVDNNGRAAYVQLRFLNEGKDFCSAVFAGVQDHADVLFGLNLATDNGAWHPNLDKIDGKFTTGDLRLRLEIGGYIEGVSWSMEQDKYDVSVSIGNQILRLKQLAAVSEWDEPQLQISKEDGLVCVDYVFYNGEKRCFNFHDLEQAAWSYLCTLSKQPEYLQPRAHISGDFLVAAMTAVNGNEFSISLKLKPDLTEKLFKTNISSASVIKKESKQS
ncbi:hypothetical protein [Paenibacillus roseipurpureus]|uniref:Uncharacterized protein n=1 Tax=Paenibacillus roseopurpureus TaxID=2918901 RepID=A0AA96LQF8_9BACL|nr:hypothetical protein [Paenibacillus sp. MBLB1832]WNR45269.1 hypothetical protein MJB10_03795 [Paenibacillus sp. MBLB1832]